MLRFRFANRSVWMAYEGWVTMHVRIHSDSPDTARNVFSPFDNFNVLDTDVSNFFLLVKWSLIFLHSNINIQIKLWYKCYIAYSLTHKNSRS